MLGIQLGARPRTASISNKTQTEHAVRLVKKSPAHGKGCRAGQPRLFPSSEAVVCGVAVIPPRDPARDTSKRFATISQIVGKACVNRAPFSRLVWSFTRLSGAESTDAYALGCVDPEADLTSRFAIRPWHSHVCCHGPSRIFTSSFKLHSESKHSFASFLAF